VSITVLAIGLMASALLMSNTYRFSVRSRYAAEAAQMASEKLEDMNRYPAIDEHVTVMPGDNACGLTGESCEGSLASPLSNPPPAPVSAQITAAGTTYTVYYSDSVFLSSTNNSGLNGTTANGSLQETYQTAGSPNPNYATLTFTPAGSTPAVTNSSTAPTVGETFDRRWVIEQDQPVAGVRRITVLVTLMDQTIKPPVTFQMSMVRP
jgi:hypothetical protein